VNPIDVSFRMKYWEIIADNLKKPRAGTRMGSDRTFTTP